MFFFSFLMSCTVLSEQLIYGLFSIFTFYIAAGLAGLLVHRGSCRAVEAALVPAPDSPCHWTPPGGSSRSPAELFPVLRVSNGERGRRARRRCQKTPAPHCHQ